MDKVRFGLLALIFIASLFAPGRFRRSRPHGIGYLIGLVIVTGLIWVISRHIMGYYTDALGSN